MSDNGKARAIPRPADTEECGIPECGCPFGQHFVSFDGKISGCSNPDKYPRRQGNNRRCSCPGFAVLYRYVPEVRGALVAAGQTSGE